MNARQAATEFVAKALAIGAADPHSYTRLLISATAADPSFSPAYFHLADIMAQTGALDAACVLYNKCVALDSSNVKAWVNLSYRAHWAGRLHESLDAAEHALALDPRDTYAYVNRSITQSTLGDHTAALSSALCAV